VGTSTTGPPGKPALTVLVTGATGAVGPALAERLVRDGHRVRTLSRSRPATLPLPAAVESLLGDVTDRSAVARSVVGVDWVFHLAAHLHTPNPDPVTRASYERTNIEGTRVVVEEAAAAGASRLVFFSSISVYGPTGPMVADEATPPRPDTLYGATKLRAEEVARSAVVRGSQEPLACVLRLGAVYGQRMKGNYPRLARAVRGGWFVPIGPGLNRRTLVHEADAAEAAVLAAGSSRAAGQVYNVTDGRIYPLREIIDAMCAAFRRRPPRWGIPVAPARVLASLGDGLLRIAHRDARLQGFLEKYLEDVAVSGEKVASELGYRPRFDLESGWRDALALMMTTTTTMTTKAPG
jgi:nucleoside-diphosphate-sugar epimerase